MLGEAVHCTILFSFPYLWRASLSTSMEEASQIAAKRDPTWAPLIQHLRRWEGHYVYKWIDLKLFRAFVGGLKVCFGRETSGNTVSAQTQGNSFLAHHVVLSSVFLRSIT